MRFSNLIAKITHVRLFKNQKVIVSLVSLFIISGISFLIISQIIGFTQGFSHTITYGLVGKISRINPLWSALNPIDEMLTKLIYRPLIGFDTSGKPAGDLAEKWELSDDQKSYTIHLKSNQTWQDGKPITADDVIFTINLTQKEDYAGPEKPRFSKINVEKIDDLTIRFTLGEIFAPFLESLDFNILPKHIWDNLNIAQIKTSEHNLKPVGSTNFQVKKISSKFTQPGEINQIVLENRSFSTNRNLPKNVVIRLYSNEQESNLAFKLGEIDTILINDATIAKKFAEWPNLNQKLLPICGQTLTLFYNLTRDKDFPTQKNDFKLAISSALSDSNLKVGTSPIPPNHWSYTLIEESPHQDEETSKQVFADVNLESGLTLATLNDRVSQLAAQDLFTALQKYGLKLNIEVFSPKELYKEVFPERKFDLLLIQQKFGHDPDQYAFWHSSQTDLKTGGLNVSGYANRQMDKALEDGRKTTSEETRKQAYATFQKRLTSDQPALFLTYPPLYEISRLKQASPAEDRCLWHETDYFVEKHN